MLRLLVIPLLALALLGAAACGDDDDADPTPDATATTPAGETPTDSEPTEEPTDAPTGEPTEEPTDTPEPAFEGTLEPTSSGDQLGEVQTLVRVEVGRHDEGFDRIVFEFEGDTLPAYLIEYQVPPPVQCGSGLSADVQGRAILNVQLRPAQAHDENGEITIVSPEILAQQPTILEAEQTCDFEAHVVWAVGVEERREYRVMELSGPTRLVIDILH